MRGPATASRESKGGGVLRRESFGNTTRRLASHTDDKEPTLTRTPKFLRSNDNRRAAHAGTLLAGGHHRLVGTTQQRQRRACSAIHVFARRPVQWFVALGGSRLPHDAECNTAVNAGDARRRRWPTGPAILKATPGVADTHGTYDTTTAGTSLLVSATGTDRCKGTLIFNGETAQRGAAQGY